MRALHMHTTTHCNTHTTDVDGERRPIMDVYNEIQSTLVPRYVPRGFVMRCKPVKRKYAFDMPDVPRGETEYLKVCVTTVYYTITAVPNSVSFVHRVDLYCLKCAGLQYV
jgi:hypothetical protein